MQRVRGAAWTPWLTQVLLPGAGLFPKTGPRKAALRESPSFIFHLSPHKAMFFFSGLVGKQFLLFKTFKTLGLSF